MGPIPGSAGSRRSRWSVGGALLLGALCILPALSPTVNAAPFTQASEQRALEFSERLVAGGGEHDAVAVRHLRLRGTQRDIGRKLAELARERHGVHPMELAADVKSERAAFYASTYPEHLERSLGARDLFGLESESPLDASLLPYNLPERFGCSVVFYPGASSASGHATLSRNYDFSTAPWTELAGPAAYEPDRRNAEDPYVIEVYPDTGYASLFLTAYELLGSSLDGINSEGLTVALLANETLRDQQPTMGWRPGLSELEVVRYLLETCATVDEARDAIDRASFYYCLVPCHYIIGDRNGDSFIFEYSSDLEEVYTVEGGGRPLWVTNHPVHEYPSVDDLPPNLTSNTYARFRKLHEEITKAPAKRTDDDMKHANSCVKAVDSGPYKVRTLWHGLYDCEQRTLSVDFYLGEAEAGEERRSGYLPFALEH